MKILNVLREEDEPTIMEAKKIADDVISDFMVWRNNLPQMKFTDDYGNEYNFSRPEINEQITTKSDNPPEWNLNFNITIGVSYGLSGDKVPDTLFYEPLKNFIKLYNEFLDEKGYKPNTSPYIFITFLHINMNNILIYRKGYSPHMRQSISLFIDGRDSFDSIPTHHTINDITTEKRGKVLLDRTIIHRPLPSIEYISEDDKDRALKRTQKIFNAIDKGYIPVNVKDGTKTYQVEYKLIDPKFVIHSGVSNYDKQQIVFGAPKGIIAADLILPKGAEEMRATVSERLRPYIVKKFNSFKILLNIREVLYGNQLKIKK